MAMVLVQVLKTSSTRPWVFMRAVYGFFPHDSTAAVLRVSTYSIFGPFCSAGTKAFFHSDQGWPSASKTARRDGSKIPPSRITRATPMGAAATTNYSPRPGRLH
jgi:hypothetical protein